MFLDVPCYYNSYVTSTRIGEKLVHEIVWLYRCCKLTAVEKGTGSWMLLIFLLQVPFTAIGQLHVHLIVLMQTRKQNNDSHAESRVPTRTGKPGKPGKMGRHFPVREKSGNFEQTGKVREKSGKITQNTGKLR